MFLQKGNPVIILGDSHPTGGWIGSQHNFEDREPDLYIYSWEEYKLLSENDLLLFLVW